MKNLGLGIFKIQNSRNFRAVQNSLIIQTPDNSFDKIKAKTLK